MATGAAWLLADQLNFLLPLLVWSLAGDEFNVAEGRRIFGWIVAWTYGGQVAGLAVSTFSPAVLTALEVPLPVLLVADPVICVFLALWLPHALRGSAAARGLARPEDWRRSVRGAGSSCEGVPVWRAFLVASIATFIAGMTAHLTFMAEAGDITGSDAAALQTLLAGVSLGSFLLCWLLQMFAAERIQDRLGIPGVLLVLPIATVVAGVLLAVGSVTGSLVVLVVGISAFRIPRWSIDENARRAALALVPDDRRARVSFIVDLGPVAVGLIVAGPVALLGIATGLGWLPQPPSSPPGPSARRCGCCTAGTRACSTGGCADASRTAGSTSRSQPRPPGHLPGTGASPLRSACSTLTNRYSRQPGSRTSTQIRSKRSCWPLRRHILAVAHREVSEQVGHRPWCQTTSVGRGSSRIDRLSTFTWPWSKSSSIGMPSRLASGSRRVHLASAPVVTRGLWSRPSAQVPRCGDARPWARRRTARSAHRRESTRGRTGNADRAHRRG